MAVRARSAETSRPWLQWASGLTGLALVCGLAAWLLVDAVRPDTPPDLAPVVTGVRASDKAWVLEFEIRNRGRETAAAVRIEGHTATSRAKAVIDYVPGLGKARGALVFDDDPREAVIRVRGWSAP